MFNAKRHITVRLNRNGTERYYFFRRGMPAIRLPDPGSPEFEPAYASLLEKSDSASLANSERGRDGYRHEWARYLWERARYRANRPCCTITPDEIADMLRKQEDRCALSRLRFHYRRSVGNGRDPMAPSLDRIDSRKGYTLDNCRIVLLAVNIGLNEWGDEVFVRLCKAVAKAAA